MSADRYVLPNGWSLIRDNDPEGGHYLDWFLCNPHDVWVAKFWDGPNAGAADAEWFARDTARQWQPMDTAPTDRPVLLMNRETGDRRVAQWMTSLEEGDGAWIISRSLGAAPVAFAFRDPDGWCDLPPLPPEAS